MANTVSSKGNILVIEDNPDWMRRLIKMCEKAGYQARRAPNMDKAVSLLQTATFDAVIADLRLKEWEKGNVDGLNSLAAVPENARPAAVIVTAHPDPDHVRVAFRDFKVIDIIFKYSFDADVFTKKLEAAVRETRRRRATLD